MESVLIDEAIDMVQQFVDWRNVKGVSATTIDNDRRVLSAFFAWACKRRLVAFRGAPCDKRFLTLPTKKTICKRALADAEISTLLDATLEHWIYPYVLLGLGCGLRPAGAARVRWEDFDFSGQRLHVHEKSRERWVPLSDWVVGELAGWRKAYMWQRPHPNTIQKTFGKLRRKAKLPPAVSLQALRRTFIKRLWTAGVPPQQAASLAGNSVAIIERHYAQFDVDTARDVVNVLDFSKMTQKTMF
jgi:integrase